MRDTSKKGHRAVSVAPLLIIGGALAAAFWIGGHPAIAGIVIAIYAVFAVVAFVWGGGGGDVAAILRGGSDERQHDIDLRATAVAGTVTALFTIVAAILNVARTGGDPGAYGVVCLVFGISYGVALAVVRRRT